jgi:hypothetical protein
MSPPFPEKRIAAAQARLKNWLAKNVEIDYGGRTTYRPFKNDPTVDYGHPSTWEPYDRTYKKPTKMRMRADRGEKYYRPYAGNITGEHMNKWGPPEKYWPRYGQVKKIRVKGVGWVDPTKASETYLGNLRKHPAKEIYYDISKEP